jgi:hypothetical protein
MTAASSPAMSLGVSTASGESSLSSRPSKISECHTIGVAWLKHVMPNDLYAHLLGLSPAAP